MLRVSNRPPVDYSKCNQTVTIYHNNNGVFSQQTITSAFFDFKKVQNVDKTGSSEVNSCLLVIPYFAAEIQPVFVGDKVVLGIGPDVQTREAWAALIPSKVANMVVVKYVDPKYWKGAIAHWEAGG